jgi:hypothetical protein
MTNSSNEPSAIDAVVAALSSSGADLSSPVKSGHAGVIYNSADDSFTQTSAAPASGMTAQPLLDDGRDLEDARGQIVANVNALEAKFNSGKFDAVTGEFRYTVTGRDRDVLAMQIQQAKTSSAYDIDRLNSIYHQRVIGGQQENVPLQMADGKAISLQEAAARMAYVDSAPPGQRVAYGQEYDRLMQEGRTRSVTDAINAARRR